MGGGGGATPPHGERERKRPEARMACTFNQKLSAPRLVCIKAPERGALPHHENTKLLLPLICYSSHQREGGREREWEGVGGREGEKGGEMGRREQRQ